MALTVCVTGNIGSGKTTLTKLLAERFVNACYISEPHDINPFLPLYLKDKPRWGFTAQLRYFWDYARVYQQTVSQRSYDFHFVDAGIWTNRLVYAAYLRQEQIISDDEFTFYGELCDSIQQARSIPDPQAFIFIKASPQTCWDRMHRRGWQYQVSAIDLAYIEALHDMISAMQQTVSASGVPTLELSSEHLDFTTPAGQDEALAQVQPFLDLHQGTHE